MRFLKMDSIKSIEHINHSPYRSYTDRKQHCTMVRWWRWSVWHRKTVFRDFWSYRPQNKSIWSKISRGNWFWRLKLSIPSEIKEKWRKTDFRNQKTKSCLKRFFDVLVVAKRGRRLEFWQRVALDFPDDPERQSDDQNLHFSKNFREKYKNFSKKQSKNFRDRLFL